jgi:hypothetical protein
MRSIIVAASLGVIVLVVVSLSVTTHRQREAAERARAEQQQRQGRGLGEVKKSPTWVISGTWKKDQDEALEDALKEAGKKLTAYFRARRPGWEWTPPPDYISQHLTRDLPADDPAVKRETQEKATPEEVEKDRCKFVDVRRDFGDPVGLRHKVILKIGVRPEDLQGLVNQDQDYRHKMEILAREQVIQGRMLLLAKVFGVVIALLLVVAGYIRLDEYTKGYYTGWLKVAAFGILAGVGIALFMR